MASLLAVYDAPGSLVRALEDPAHQPTPQQLEAAHRELLNLGRRVPRPATWTTADDAKEDVEALLSGLSGALEHIGRSRASLDEPRDVKPKEEKVKPEPEQALPTPVEENDNPLAQAAQPHRQRTPTPRARPSPSPAPGPAALALPPRPANPFAPLSSAHFPSRAVPPAFFDPSTGRHVFAGPFIRQKTSSAKCRNLDFAWTDVGGGNAATLDENLGVLCLKPYLCTPPTGPGEPFIAFTSPDYHDLIVGVGRALSVYIACDGRWSFEGDYLPVTQYYITGTELGALEDDAKDEWVRFFGGVEEKKRETLLGIWSLDLDLKGGENIWDAAVAAGDECEVYFSAFVCAGFDTVLPRVAKRALRLAFEAADAGSEVEEAALAEMRRFSLQERAEKDAAEKAAKKAARAAKAAEKRQASAEAGSSQPKKRKTKT